MCFLWIASVPCILFLRAHTSKHWCKVRQCIQQNRCTNQQMLPHCCHIFTPQKCACMIYWMFYQALSCVQVQSSCHSWTGFATPHPGNRASYACNHSLGAMAWQTMLILCNGTCPTSPSLSMRMQPVPESWHSLNCARFVSQAQSRPPISIPSGLCTTRGQAL